MALALLSSINCSNQELVEQLGQFRILAPPPDQLFDGALHLLGCPVEGSRKFTSITGPRLRSRQLPVRAPCNTLDVD